MEAVAVFCHSIEAEQLHRASCMQYCLQWHQLVSTLVLTFLILPSKRKPSSSCLFGSNLTHHLLYCIFSWSHSGTGDSAKKLKQIHEATVLMTVGTKFPKVMKRRKKFKISKCMDIFSLLKSELTFLDNVLACPNYFM